MSKGGLECVRPFPRGWRSPQQMEALTKKTTQAVRLRPAPAGGPSEMLRFPPVAGGTGSCGGVAGRGGRSRHSAARQRRCPRAMLPSAEVPRAEPRPKAGPHGGGSRRCSDFCWIPAHAPTKTTEQPSLCDSGRSPAIPVPGSPNEVGRRLGTMTTPGMERWRDRLALVTGASGGIGAAVARALVQQGLKVVGCARTVGNIEVRLRWAEGNALGDVVSTG